MSLLVISIAIGRAAREGLADAARDAPVGVALDAVLPEAADYASQSLAGTNFVDDAADVAKALKKIGKLGRLKR